MVNGQPLVSEVVNAEESDLTVTVPTRDPVEFVEVFSEQDVRLAMLFVADPPPSGALVQTAEVVLSGGRRLRVCLSFDSPWPIVHVTYMTPCTQIGMNWPAGKMRIARRHPAPCPSTVTMIGCGG